MRTEVLERHYAVIGAPVKIESAPFGTPRLDVHTDTRGEHVVIGGVDDDTAEVVNVDRAGRHHLLLLTRSGDEKSKFLCGHDERHWFVAAIPEDAFGITDVASAKAALQPKLVRDAVSRARPKDRFKRRHSAYVREGEWFFVPEAKLDPPASQVLRNEPLTRGRSKDHVMERAYRAGETLVYLAAGFPQGCLRRSSTGCTAPRARLAG